MRGTFKKQFILASTVMLGACASSSQPGSAPKPPSFYPAAYRSAEREPITTFTQSNMPRLANIDNYSNIEPASGYANIEPEAGPSSGFNIDDSDYEQIQNSAGIDGQDCNKALNFESKALVAYQWNNNRVGFDSDSIGYDPRNNSEEFKLSFRLRLQEPKTMKHQCQGKGIWQGFLDQ